MLKDIKISKTQIILISVLLFFVFVVIVCLSPLLLPFFIVYTVKEYRLKKHSKIQNRLLKQFSLLPVHLKNKYHE